MTFKPSRLRSVERIRQSIDTYTFDNPEATLQNSRWLQNLASELAKALQRENDSLTLNQRAEAICLLEDISYQIH